MPDASQLDWAQVLADPWILRGALIFGVFVFLLFLVRVINRGVLEQIEDNRTRYRARKALQTLAFALGAWFGLATLMQRPDIFSVAIGLASAGVAFALQDVILSIAGWIAIHWLSIYRSGDRIEMTGVRGDVIDINLLQTTVMEIGGWVEADLYNGRIVRIGNNHIFKNPVLNYTADFPFLWDEIVIPIKFTSDHEQARSLMLRIADEVVGDYARESKERWADVVLKYLIEDASTTPVVKVAANDNYLMFRLRYIVDYRLRRSTVDLLTTRILEAIRQTGGAVELASETLQLVDVPQVDVSIKP